LGWRNQDAIRRWFVHSEVIALADHRAWFARYEDRDDDFLFIIEETRDLHKPVGQVGLYRIEAVRGSAEFGRLLIGEADARGKGLAQKATALVLDFAFCSLGLQEVLLEVLPENEPAKAVYRRCGFVPTGLRNGLLQMRAATTRGGMCLRA
jgi:diamine N-acetyltransferase